MIRRLELLLVSAFLVVAAFSTGWTFLFFLLYLAILVIGGSYVLVRLGLTDLEAGYAVSQLHGHVGDRMRVTYTLRNAQPAAEALAGGAQPDDPARSAAGPSAHARGAERTIVADPGPALAPRTLPDRAAAHPDRRSLRLLRGGRDGRPGRVGRRLPTPGAHPRLEAAGGDPGGQPRLARSGRSRPPRWRPRSGRTPRATR